MAFPYPDAHNPYARTAANAAQAERVAFIQRTYAHLGGAVLAFTGLSALIISSGLGQALTRTMLATQWSWLIVLGLFMVVGHVARRWAESGASTQLQYAGLGLYVVAQAVLFTPLLYVAAYFSDPSVIPSAGLLTAVVFGGLTGTVFLTKRDFSFLGRALMLAGFASFGMILVSMIFGFTLGAFFAAAMVALAAGYVLYETSNIMHRYPTSAHVAASLALFAAVALMFWYVLRLLMALSSRD
jgi:FtsH-binding integral membrane protein